VEYAHFDMLVRAFIRADLIDLHPRVSITELPSRWVVTVVIPGRGAVRDFFSNAEVATQDDVLDFVGAVVEEVREVLL